MSSSAECMLAVLLVNLKPMLKACPMLATNSAGSAAGSPECQTLCNLPSSSLLSCFNKGMRHARTSQATPFDYQGLMVCSNVQ